MRPGIAALILSTTLALTACRAINLADSTYPNGTVTVSPTIAAMAAGSSQVFTATTSNDPNQVFWNVGFSLTSVVNEGTINGGTANVSANSVTYTAPPTPPIYTTGGATPTQQGIASVTATLVTGLLTGVTVTEDIAILAPSVTAGLTPATATVALGSTTYFVGYAVGNINNGVNWQVNGIAGGSSTVGTVSPVGGYTAPASLPVTGNTVTLTVISAADPTKTASSTITLQ